MQTSGEGRNLKASVGVSNENWVDCKSHAAPWILASSQADQQGLEEERLFRGSRLSADQSPLLPPGLPTSHSFSRQPKQAGIRSVPF